MSAGRRAIPQSQWERDEDVKACPLCGKAFGALTRRHHCRQCGKVFCSGCSDHEVAMMENSGNIKQGLRCCNTCYASGFRSAIATNEANPRVVNVTKAPLVETSASETAPTTRAPTDSAEKRALLFANETAARDELQHEETTLRDTMRSLATTDAERIEDTLRLQRSITAPSVSGLRNAAWIRLNTVDNVEIFTAQIGNLQKKACKFVLTANADIGVTIAVISDISLMLQFDPLLQAAEVLPGGGEGVSVVVTKYRSSGIVSGRDFATTTANHFVPVSEVVDLIPQYDGDTPYAAFVYGSIDNTSVQANAGYVRGTVHSFGYVLLGVRTAEGLDVTRMVNISHVDPKGSIPAFLLETTFTDSAKRLARLRAHVEAQAKSLGGLSTMCRLLRGSGQIVDDVETPEARSPPEQSRGTDVPQPAPQSTSPNESSLKHAPNADEHTGSDQLEATLPTPPPPAITPKKRRVLQPLMDLYRQGNWRMSKTLEECDLEDCAVSFSEKKALRITTQVKCTIATFAAFLADASQIPKFDPTLDKFEVLFAHSDGETSVVYSNYKQVTRLIAPRDFCAESGSAMLSAEETRDEGLHSRGIVFVQGSINSTAKPPVKGYTRGTLHVYGFVATADSDDSSSIKISNVMCVDPSGNIPNWLIDAAQAESCKKVAKIRSLCEERQRTNPAVQCNSPPRSASAPRSEPNTLPPESESDEFRSCFDDAEYEQDRERLRQFHADEVDRICAVLTTLHTSPKWEGAKSIDDCKVQMAEMSGCSVKAVKISLEFPCGIETFKSVISNIRTTFQTDNTVEKVDVLQSPPFGSVIYTSYKSTSKFLSSRDFCTLSTSKLLTEEEGAELGLYTKGIRSSAFVVSTVNSTDMPEQPGYVRGFVHGFGYIAVATPPNAKRIRVFHIAAVDPKGQIPAKLVDLAVSDTCKKMMKLKDSCVAAEATRMYVTEANVDQASPAAPVEGTFVEIERPFINLQTCRTWQNPRQIGDHKVESCSVPGTDLTAHRVSGEFKCSLATFEAMLNSTNVAAQIDPSLEMIRVLPCKQFPGASVVYTAYKSGSRLVTSRDFCAATCCRYLTAEQGASLGLFTEGITSAAFLHCSVNSEEVPPQPQYVRGVIHTFGYLALATPPTAKRIRVFQIGAVAPGGSINPKWIANAITETANKLKRLGVLCEEKEREAAVTQRDVPEPEVLAEEGALLANRPDADQARDIEPAKIAEEPSEPAPEQVPVSNVSSPSLGPLPQQILRSIVELHLRCSTWKKVKVLHECLLEDTTVAFSDKHAQRITTQMKCSLRTFHRFLGDASMLKRYDPTLAKFEVVERQRDDVATTYSAYAQATRLISARDFCSQSARVLLDGSAARPFGFDPDCGSVLIANSIDSSAVPPQKGFIRGKIHLYGFIATSETLDTVPISVSSLMCVDPSGSIPTWVVEVATAESVKKVAKIRELVAQYHAA